MRRITDNPPLNSIESLLLAQSVWELGAGTTSWVAIAKLLSKHPLITRPKSFFNAQTCHSMYDDLMRRAGLERNAASDSIHAPSNLKLAQIHYQQRLAELRVLITAEENKFKSIVAEIQEIKAGEWDNRIREKLAGVHVNSVRPSVSQSEEVFEGSDLSGVTDSGSSTSQLRDQVNSPAPLRSQDSVVKENATLQAPPDQAVEPEVSQDETINDRKDVNGSEPSVIAEDITMSSLGLTDSNRPGVTPVIDVHVSDVEKNAEVAQIPTSTERVIEEPASSIAQRQEEEEEEECSRTNPEEEETDYEADTTAVPVGEHIENSPANLQIPVDPDEERKERTSNIGYVKSNSVEDEANMSEEEPQHMTRRSTRRRKSSAASSVPPLQTRGRSRRQRHTSVSPPADGESNMDVEVKVETPQVEEETSPVPTDSRREGKRKASFLETADYSRDRKRVRDESEPAEEDEPNQNLHNTRPRPTRNGTRTEEQVALKRFQNVIGMLHSQISQHRNGNIFHNPIKNSEAPDYHEIVKRPIDLKTIKTRVKDGIIANSLEFQRDIYLMFANAMMYNRPGSDVYIMAEDMMLESEGHILAFRQTEGLVRGVHRL